MDLPTSPVTPPQQGCASASLDFSFLSPLQFGITTTSFSVPSKPKDKSRVSQLKARRRSTIGVRGSPETNSLIRHIAKQRMQAASPTLSHLRLPSSLPRSQSLKQKMASFQVGLVDVDEEGNLPWMTTPGKSAQKKDCVVADNLSSTVDKENRGTQGYLSRGTPPPSKRVCAAGPLQECEGEIRGAATSRQLPACTSPNKQVRIFDLASPCSHQGNAFFQHMPLSLLSQQTNRQINNRDEPLSVAKKRVRFGAPLSPEFFDKTLPPSTPLQKGATPFRHAASEGSKLRSLLKTPQRSETKAKTPQPPAASLLTSPEAGNGSPTLSHPRVMEGIVCSDVVFRDTEDQIPPLILEESDETEPGAELNSSDAEADQVSSPQQETAALPPPPPLPHPPPPSVQEQKQEDPTPSKGNGRPRGRKRKQPAASVADIESEPQPQPQPQSESQEQPSLPAPPPPPASSSGKRVLHAQRQLPPKRVRFSAPLSPEFFDKTLPASTPLRKGGTPFRLQPSSEGPKLCGVLKTPQTNDAAPTLQTAAVSREADCGSPTLKLAKPAVSSKLVPEAVEEISESQIPRLLLEESDEVEGEVKSAGLTKESASDELPDAQTPNTSPPCHVEPPSEEQTAGAELNPVCSPRQEPPPPPPTAPSSPPPTAPSSPPPSPPHPTPQQQEQQDSVVCDPPVKTRGRKKRALGPVVVVITAPATAEEEEEEEVEEPQPERRRTSRSAALSASGKMKSATGKRGAFGKKAVDRTLYGKREFASKNPLLSPIVESLSQSHSLTGGGSTLTSPCGTPAGSLAPHTVHSTQAHVVDMAPSTTEPNEEITDEPETKTETSAARPSLAKEAQHCEEDVGPHHHQESASQAVKKRASMSRAKAKRRSSIYVSSEVEEPVGRQERAEVIEESVGEGGPPLGSDESGSGSVQGEVTSLVTSSGREEQAEEAGIGLPNVVTAQTDNTSLAPWQQDFNIEDVFKPLAVAAAVGRRSVRRSLRNRASEQGMAADTASGLAWVERKSPDVAKSAVGARRRRSSRVNSTPALPEAPQHQE